MQHEASGTSLHLLKSLPYCKLHCKGLAVSALKFNSNKGPHLNNMFDLHVGHNLKASPATRWQQHFRIVTLCQEGDT